MCSQPNPGMEGSALGAVAAWAGVGSSGAEEPQAACLLKAFALKPLTALSTGRWRPQGCRLLRISLSLASSAASSRPASHSRSLRRGLGRPVLLPGSATPAAAAANGAPAPA